VTGSSTSIFVWLTPPSFAGSLAIADIANAPTPEARTALVKDYVNAVWALWSQAHLDTIAQWYERFVASDKVRRRWRSVDDAREPAPPARRDWRERAV
jgi:hypothetical protein